jgi:hypothetical protein
MKTIEEVKEEIRKNVKWERPDPNPGGQQCGMPHRPMILYSEELDLRISLDYHRSSLKNREAM